MKSFQRRLCKLISLISSVVFCLGVLIAPSPLGAQSSKASTSVQTKLPGLENGLDPLHILASDGWIVTNAHVRARRTSDPRSA